MDFKLNDEQRGIVRTVRELTQDKFKPTALKYMDGTFPWENIRDLAKIGVLGMAVPEEYGGLGLPVLDTALVLEEIAKGCYVTAMAVLGEVGVQSKIIDDVCARGHQATPAARGVYGRGDPCSVHDRAARRNRRRQLPNQCGPHGDKLVLNGVKTLISRVDEAQAFVVFSRVDRRRRPRRHRLRADRARHAGLHLHRALSHDGRRESRRDPIRELRAASGEPDRSRGRIPAAAELRSTRSAV